MLENNIYTRKYVVTILAKELGEFPHFIVGKEEGITETLPLINDPEDYKNKYNVGDQVLLTQMWKKPSYEEYKSNNDKAGKESLSKEAYEQSNVQGTYYGYRLSPYVIEKDNSQVSTHI